MSEKGCIGRTCGISLDFEALNKFGLDSNRKIQHKSRRSRKDCSKSLSDQFGKESLGYWSDPDGNNYFENFSMENSDRSTGRQNGDSSDENQDLTFTQEKANEQEVDDNETQKSGQNSVVSDAVSLHAVDENLDSPVKIKSKGTKPKTCGCKAKLSLELKAKIEEEKNLKIEHDKLEYKVIQMEKIQNSIDKYKEKICDLKKRKEGEILKSTVKSKNKNKPDKVNLSANEMMGKMNVACTKALQYAGLENIIDKDEFLSALLERATSCRKK